MVAIRSEHLETLEGVIATALNIVRTRPLADLYVRRDHSPVPSPSLVRSEKQRAPKCRVQAFTSRTNHLNCCRNNTSIATTWSILGPAQRDRGNASWLESPFQRFANPPALTL